MGKKSPTNGRNESQRNFSLLWMLVELSGSPRLVDPRKVHCYTEELMIIAVWLYMRYLY